MGRARTGGLARQGTPPSGRAQPAPKRLVATGPAISSPARPLTPPSAAADATLARLTAQAKALLAQSNGGDARTRVALGAVLQQVHARVEHGQWLGWLEETVPFTPRPAQNHIEPSAWAQARPAAPEQVATLGASKVYLMSKLPPPLLDQLLAKPDHLVPGTKRRTTLLLMKYAELMKLVLSATRPASPAPDPMVVLLGDVRSSASQTIKLIKVVIANKQAIDDDAVEDLHDDLAAALQALSAAFKLD